MLYIMPTGKTPHEVFTDHYPALCKLLSASSKDLLPHFVASRIISISEEEEINAKENPMDKAVSMLRSVSSGVECGRFNSFHKMLGVMWIHGTNDVKDLSSTISKLVSIELPAPVGMLGHFCLLIIHPQPVLLCLITLI